nr:sulfate transporter 3.1-like [Tanacetum cinerariifolium]
MGGAARVVCLQQLKGILGLVHFTHGTDLVSVLRSVFSQTHGWMWENALLGVCFLFYLLVARYVSQKRPKLFWISAMAPLTSVILGSVLVYLTHAEKHGVQVAKGSRYRGQYRQGLRHGYGIYRFYVGDIFVGEWFKGQCLGVGVHTCQDGSKYFGEFKSGVKHGIGHYHFRNGDMYAGAEAVVALSNHHYNYKLKSGNMYCLVPKSSQVSEPRVVNKDEDWGGCERKRIKV